METAVMDTAVQELKQKVCIKAVKGLYRGSERVDTGAGFRPEVKICLERARLVTESYRETEWEPMVIRRAKALKKVLENMTIYIQDKERIVGNMASDPYSLPTYPELYWRWLEKAVENEYRHLLDDKGREELKEINSYWKGKSVHGMERDLVPESMKPHLWYNGVTSFSYQWDMVLPNYEKILRVGLRGIMKEAEERLKEIEADLDMNTADYMEQRSFLQAAIISLEAVINFAKRYAALAREKAMVESDLKRRRELAEIAEICDWVPENPARTLHEALQAFFFVHLIIDFIELPTLGQGVRLDQIAYPFYKKDIEEKRITREEALNLIELLWIKFRAYSLVIRFSSISFL